MLSRFMGRATVEEAKEAQEETAVPDPRQRVGMVVDMADSSWIGGLIPAVEAPRLAYSRPEWLCLVSDDELTVSGDQRVRPVLTPRDPSSLPLYAGYAETINAGKTPLNEDQASAKILHLVEQTYDSEAPKGAPTPCPGRKFVDKAPPKVQEEDDEEEDSEDEEPEPENQGLDDEPLSLSSPTDEGSRKQDAELVRTEAFYFGLFDGHAGTGAALIAAHCLHEHIRGSLKERLSQVVGTLVHLDAQETALANSAPVLTPNGKLLTRDSLVIGALETAFVEMDDQIAEEKTMWRIPGGCAGVAALFLLGRLYVANAGDCRALLLHNGRPRPLSTDHTPDAERHRLQHLPELIGKQFTRLEYNRHLTRRDVKKKVLYRDWYMNGWALKTVRETDVRPPLISDGIRKVRLLNTIGVSRGFGDHHLMTLDDRIPIKPFLSPVPQVEVLDLSRLDSINERDVVVLASDGLWDVLSNDDVATILTNALSHSEEQDHPTMYTLAAQDLVIAARGDPLGPGGRWTLSVPNRSGGHASSDDISVFVIPLKYALAPPNLDDDDEPLLIPE